MSPYSEIIYQDAPHWLSLEREKNLDISYNKYTVQVCIQLSMEVNILVLKNESLPNYMGSG